MNRANHIVGAVRSDNCYFLVMSHRPKWNRKIEVIKLNARSDHALKYSWGNRLPKHVRISSPFSGRYYPLGFTIHLFIISHAHQLNYFINKTLTWKSHRITAVIFVDITIVNSASSIIRFIEGKSGIWSFRCANKYPEKKITGYITILSLPWYKIGKDAAYGTFVHLK